MPCAVQLYAFVHCFVCDVSMCGVPLCALMKSALHHYVKCGKEKCELCGEVRRIAGMHIQECKDVSCKVPHRFFMKWFVCLNGVVYDGPCNGWRWGVDMQQWRVFTTLVGFLHMK